FLTGQHSCNNAVRRTPLARRGLWRPSPTRNPLGESHDRDPPTPTHRRLPVRRRSLLALWGTHQSACVSLPHVPKGLRQLFRPVRRRPAKRLCLGEGHTGRLQKLGGGRAKLLPRLRNTPLLPLPRAKPHLDFAGQPRSSLARSPGEAIWRREPVAV